MPGEHLHPFRNKCYLRRKMEKRERRRKTLREVDKKKKASFKTIGLYVTIGNHFIKSIKRGQVNNESTTTFDDLFTPHDGFLVEDEKEVFKSCVTPRPPMSDTMRKIILDLNQCHLIDENSNTIQEESEESLEQTPPLLENPLKRPKWNNFVDQQIISRQRFLNTFTTDFAFRKEHLEKEKQAEREAVQKKLTQELKLPKVSKTTEDLILRRTNLDNKLQIMKICHENRLQYKEDFVERRTSRSTTSTPQHRKKTMLRSRSWHSSSHPDKEHFQTRDSFFIK